MMRNLVRIGPRLALATLMALTAGGSTALAKAKVRVVPKWDRFEQAFKSRVAYSNAVQDVVVKVVFTSPLGDQAEVEAFWDGGRTWRVRFMPDQAGRWTFRTACSDPANAGLNRQTGEFVCTPATGLSRFQRHGPVQVARDHRYLEHADGTPFFWLADTVWNGARVAEPKEWQFYAGTRARQRFTVVQWAVAPGEDVKQQRAWTGIPQRITINPAFFQRLDAKLKVLSQAGLLSAIVPLLETQEQKADGAALLPDDQTEWLLRYMVARWGAEPVAWLLAFEADRTAKDVGRWKRIGQAVFGSQRLARGRAPVVLFTGDTPWLLDEFREEQWVDVFGCRSITDMTEDALKWALSGPFATEWLKEPTRPLISFAPGENQVRPGGDKRFTAEDVRRAAYWGLLLAPPAGVSYSAHGVANWDRSVQPAGEKPRKEDLPLWRKALSMPGAKQMTHLSKLMNSVAFEGLRPQPKAVATQPGTEAPQRFISAASSEPNTLSLVYVPEDRTVELRLTALPASPVVGWLNPRTGESHPAVAVVGGDSCRFPTPEPGDWLLQLKAGK